MIEKLIALEIFWRLFGALLGAILSNLAAEPRSWAGVVERLVFSVICGTVFAHAFGEWLGFLMETPDHVIAAACACSALGWFVAHGIIRMVQAGRFPGVRGG